ncbi:MAG: YigZ family protein [Bacteroidetes bacterium]|nr:MAG: YigZ family protein [Bacteroidota bacterium]
MLFQLKEAGEGLVKDRGSKFYSFAFPVHSQEEIGQRLRELKKKYYDARHHCYAWRLGAKGEEAYATDDREPTHSAGPPILAAIHAAELTNVLVVVVRYFGGTKLGIRGLIEAYRSAAEAALEGLAREPLVPKITFRLHFPYSQTSEINRILHPYDTELVDATYTDSCTQTLAIYEGEFPGLYQKLKDAGLEVDVLA